MKKLLLSVLAISALVACSKSDVIEMPQSQAIKFGSAFVDNSTKAIDPTWQHTVDGALFKVWGKLSTTNGSTNIFSGVDVTKSGTGIGNTWHYSEDKVQYWIPSVNYSFAAIAGTTSSVDADADGMPATISYDAATQSDLLYASATAIGSTNEQEVKFTFSHLLSRAQFKFVNAYPEQSDLYIQVSDIKINDAYKSGSYDIETSSWTATDNSYDLVFGNGVKSNEKNDNVDPIYVGSNKACYSNKVGLLVPATYDKDNATTDKPEFKLSFKVEVFLKQVIAGVTKYTQIDALTQDFTTDNLVPDGTLTFNNNCSYNFVITVGENDLEPIKFGLEKVEYWTPTTPDTNIGI